MGNVFPKLLRSVLACQILKLFHTATSDTTRLSRLPVDRHRHDAGQTGLAARRCTPRKMYRRYGLLHVTIGLNFFTKRHATRVICRLTVQTLPDGLETQFTPPDTTQTALSRRVWREMWIGHNIDTLLLERGWLSTQNCETPLAMNVTAT